MVQQNNSKYFLIGFVVVTILVAVLLIYPYILPIFNSMVLAYIFYPLYNWFNKKIKRENVSAFIVSLIIVFLITVPIGFFLFQVSQEANVSYVILKQNIARGQLIDADCTQGFLCSVTKKVGEWFSNPEVSFYLSDSLKKVTTNIAEGAISFIASIPSRLIGIFITFFITFFLLKDGKQWIKKLEKHTPLRKKQKDRIFKQMHEVTRAIIYGFFLVALLQGVIMAGTFYFADVTSPILWGVVVGLLALVPIIGGAVVWIPAMLIKFAGGSSGDAIAIAIGGIIVSSIDTFLKPKIVGDKASIHPILIVLGILGGISVFGFAGIIIGPLILALVVTSVQMYVKG